MSNFDPDFWNALHSAIGAAWPEITTSNNSVILRVSQANRLNWANILEKATDYITPYVIVHVGTKVEAPEWGLVNSTYLYPVILYYIASVSSSDDIAAHVEAKMAALRDHLRVTRYDDFQLIGQPQIDVSDENGANEAFTQYQYPLFAGALMANLLVGETISVQ